MSASFSPGVAVAAVVPAFNAARYLAETLDSLLAQSPAPAEIVVVDDGSDDGTGAIARAYADRGVRLVRQANAGSAAAKNAGAAETTAPLLTFVDADDICPERSIAARVAVLTNDPALDGVAGRVECFPSPEIDPRALASLVIPQGPQRMWLSGALLLRRAAWEKVGLFNTSLGLTGEFIDWIARARALGLAMGEIDDVALRRRVHPASLTVRARREVQIAYLATARTVLARLRHTA